MIASLNRSHVDVSCKIVNIRYNSVSISVFVKSVAWRTQNKISCHRSISWKLLDIKWYIWVPSKYLMQCSPFYVNILQTVLQEQNQNLTGPREVTGPSWNPGRSRLLPKACLQGIVHDLRGWVKCGEEDLRGNSLYICVAPNSYQYQCNFFQRPFSQWQHMSRPW